MNKPERTLDDRITLAVVAITAAYAVLVSAVLVSANSCSKTKATTVNVSGETSTVSVNQTGGVTAGVVNGKAK